MIGYVVVGITFAIQPIVKWACDRLEGWWRIVVADVFLFFSFVGTINVWRGVWKLLDEYFLPGKRGYKDVDSIDGVFNTIFYRKSNSKRLDYAQRVHDPTHSSQLFQLGASAWGIH